MSTDLKSLNPKIGLTQFWGGTTRGPCIQLVQLDRWEGMTNTHHYLTLTKDEARLLMSDLTEWLAGDLPEETK